MKSPSDRLWQGFMWAWDVHDSSLKCAIDARITKAFKDLDYETRTSYDYLNLVHAHSSEKPDMTHSFFGPNGSFAVCFRCDKEDRGLHVHMCSTQDAANRDIERVERFVGSSALKVSLLGKAISDLTGNHKLSVLSVIFALLGSVVALTLRLSLPFSLLFVVQLTLIVAILLSLTYLIAVLVLMVLRAYYAAGLVRRL